MIFENRGVEVGTTLHHPHGQIYAFPFVPPVPLLELEADKRLGGCAVCKLLAREIADAERVVHANESVLSYVPYAARWPYEVHVTLREHRAGLSQCEPGELALLAQALQAVTRGYDELFARPFPYLMVLHQAPTDGVSDGHLHVGVLPTTPHRRQAQVPRRVRAGSRHVPDGRNARRLRARVARGDRK
jgi:UDPglucose--hexose-1-phosphate uridylyltransferase